MVVSSVILTRWWTLECRNAVLSFLAHLVIGLEAIAFLPVWWYLRCRTLGG